MKMLMTGACASAVLLLAACASGPGYGGGPGYGYDYGGPAAIGYDGYYDDAYGPFYDGYWAGDGFFYYRSGDHDRFHRDDGRHFRHDAGAGMHPVQGHPHAQGQGGHDRNHQ